MSEYDSTNSGVIFQPYEDQTLSGQGKLNIQGNESRVVIIKERLKRDGDIELVLYQKVGVLFVNDQKGNDKAPKLSGPLDQFRDLKVAAWPGMKDGRRYMSLKVSPKEGGVGGFRADGAKDPGRGGDRSANRSAVLGGHDRSRDEGRNQRDSQDRARRRDLDDEIPF